MVVRIVYGEVVRYSASVFERLGVAGEVPVAVGNQTFQVPRNPVTGGPLLIVPKAILRDLPLAESWGDIDAVVAFNAGLRKRVNEIIGSDWRRARKNPKDVLRRALVQNPGLFEELLKVYRETPARSYDFDDDPAGEIGWYSATRFIAQTFPLALVQPKTPDEAMQVVLEIARRTSSSSKTAAYRACFTTQTGHRSESLPLRRSSSASPGRTAGPTTSTLAPRPTPAEAKSISSSALASLSRSWLKSN